MTHGEFSTSGFSDALVILGAAGIVIPAFARIRISPIIGFILIGVLVGPAGLGTLTSQYPWLHYLTISVTALGLTITPLLGMMGRVAGRRIDRTGDAELGEALQQAGPGKIVILGFGRVGQIVADMLAAHKLDYVAIDADTDAVREARSRNYPVLFGDVSRGTLVGRLHLGNPSAVILTMDNPVLVARLTKRLRQAFPDLPIIARARDTAHAARLYKAGVTDAVPETLEASLQLSEAVLVDLGIAMGPVIASIHEKRSELRAQIMAEAGMEREPRLGGRRLRDSGPQVQDAGL